MFEWFAAIIDAIALAGAYEASAMFAYQPKTPSCLLKEEE